MTINYSLGFLIASLIQAAIIMLTEKFNVSSLGANVTPTQLLIHILAGQVAGYILLYIFRNFKSINKYNIWTTGIIYGSLVWGILLPLNTILGKVNAPWSQGFPTVLASLLAFFSYGVIATYTVKKANVMIRER